MFCVIILVSTVIGITPYLNNDYKNYLTEINNRVPSNTTVLANLNAEYAFDYNKLYDYRNLAFLQENGLSFTDYIKRNNIKVIIYPEEMDYIYNNRPVWNVMYGNVFPYYEKMQRPELVIL